MRASQAGRSSQRQSRYGRLHDAVGGSSARRGTAMVELAFAATPLLFIMALMILVGSLGSWKVRTHANARQAAFRAVWPRTTDRDPTPPDWRNGTSLVTTDTTLPLFPFDPYSEHTAVRGPVYSPQQGNGAIPVNGAGFDLRGQVLDARAIVNRPPAIWGRIGVRTAFTVDYHLLRNEWQYGAMGYGGNNDRRGRQLYGIHFE
jgi:hypothetical protein